VSFCERESNERESNAQGVREAEEGGGTARLDAEEGGGAEVKIDDTSVETERESGGERTRGVLSSCG
jgi:hypothetical protein